MKYLKQYNYYNPDNPVGSIKSTLRLFEKQKGKLDRAFLGLEFCERFEPSLTPLCKPVDACMK